MHDASHLVRQCMRAPGFTALFTVTLSIGIAAAVLMASALDSLLLQPPPQIERADRLVRLLVRSGGVNGGIGQKFSYPAFGALVRGSNAFSSVAAHSPVLSWLGTGPDAVQLRASLVSANYFQTLRTQPSLGRFFSPADGYPIDDGDGGPPLAVLGYGFWLRQFAGAADVIGRSILIGDESYTVVGVAAAGFRGLETESPDVWLPITVAAKTQAQIQWRSGGASNWLTVVGRLNAAATPEIAAEQATNALRSDPGVVGFVDGARVLAASVIPGRGPDAPREVRIAIWLGIVAVVVLLVASANAANLLLARAIMRRREVAVRLALGAGNGRLARQLVVEACGLTLLAAVMALLLVQGGAILLQYGIGSVVAGRVTLDGRLYAFTAVVVLLVGLLVSLAPFMQIRKADLGGALRTSGTGGVRGAATVRTVLLGAQTALCMCLLLLAGFFGKSLYNVQSLDTGVDSDHTLRAVLSFERMGLSPAGMNEVNQAIRDRVRMVPGVEYVATGPVFSQAVAAHRPGTPLGFWMRDEVKAVPMLTVVDSGYFRALGTHTLQGRDFDSGDVLGAPRVAIINSTLARIFWGDSSPLGQCILLPEDSTDPGGDCVTVVGVVPGFHRRGITNRDQVLVYTPAAQIPRDKVVTNRPGVLIIAISGKPEVVSAAVRYAIQSVRPDIPPARMVWMRDLIDPQLQPWRASAALFFLFGGIAAAIAGLGVYAVVVFAAAQRSSELAVRIALGASRGRIARDVGGEVGRAVGGGVLAGLVALLVFGPAVHPLLYDVALSDAWVVGGSMAALCMIGAIAALRPTVGVLRKAPADVLRLE